MSYLSISPRLASPMRIGDVKASVIILVNLINYVILMLLTMFFGL